MNTWDRYWSSRSSAADFYPQHERIEHAIRDIGDWKGCLAVEVGCGAGSAGDFMIELGIKPILLDYSQVSLDKCRQRFPIGSAISLVRGDVFRLPFKDESFDLLFHQGLIEHFRGEQPEFILRENTRVVKPGGWLIVEVPQAFHFESIFSRPLIWMGKWFAGWQTYYTFPRFKRLTHSLDLEDVRYFGAWMNPSFVYRSIRWALKSWLLLPLHPCRWLYISRLRRSVRQHFFYGSLVRWTGASIGFAGRKHPVQEGSLTT